MPPNSKIATWESRYTLVFRARFVILQAADDVVQIEGTMFGKQSSCAPCDQIFVMTNDLQASTLMTVLSEDTENELRDREQKTC